MRPLGLHTGKMPRLKREAIWAAVVISLILTAYAQQEWSQESIPKKSAEDIINDPANAREHWSSLSEEQKESVFKNQVGLVKFSKEFSERYDIKSLSLAKGLPRYDGASLINGDASISVASIKGAEVASLQDGGFKVRFPKNTDLSQASFNGGTKGLLIEGESLKLAQGELANGAVIAYQGKIQVQPLSEFYKDKVKIVTAASALDIYEGEAKVLQPNSMYINKAGKAIQISGEGVILDFDEGHGFEKVYKKGSMKIKDGALYSFDGKGKGTTEMPLKAPKSKLTIIDLDSSSSLQYQSQPKSVVASPCSSGNTCNRVTLIPTGAAEYKGGGFLVPKYEFVSTLHLDESEAQDIRQHFVALYNREPNLNNMEDLKLLAGVINERATYLKLEQSNIVHFPQLSESMASSVIGNSLRKAGINEITGQEQRQLDELYSFVSSTRIGKGDRLEYEVNGNSASVKYTPTKGEAREIPVSPRLTKAILRNYYDPSVNKDPESKFFLEAFFGPKKVSRK